MAGILKEANISMKRTIIALCAALLVATLAGCANNNSTASPSPKATVQATMTPAASPSAAASPSMDAAASPDATAGAGANGSEGGNGGSGGSGGGSGSGGTIEGFREGDTVAVESLPQSVTEAVKRDYPDATISAASYASYLQSEMYLLTLSGADVEKVYVDAEGKLTPYTAEATAGQ